jgi:hypothetical protein
MGIRSSLKYAISFVMFCLCTSHALNSFADECPSKLLTNQWYCLELEVQANTPGQHDGFQNMWIDSTHKGKVSNKRWRDTTDLRINALQLTLSGTVPVTEHLWIGNVVVSTQKIECLGSRQAPSAPTNLRVNRTGRGRTGIQHASVRTDHEIEPVLSRPEARKESWKKKQA